MLILVLPGRYPPKNFDGVLPLIVCGDLGESVCELYFAPGDPSSGLYVWCGKKVPCLLNRWDPVQSGEVVLWTSEGLERSPGFLDIVGDGVVREDVGTCPVREGTSCLSEIETGLIVVVRSLII